MDALCKCMFIIIKTIVLLEHEDYTFSKRFSKYLFMSIRHMKKKYQVSITSLSLH